MAKANNISVNVNVSWEPVDPASLALVAANMRYARMRYSEEHDDIHGVGHLVDEALVHIQRGANPHLGLTHETVQNELAIAIGLLFNAMATESRKTLAPPELGEPTADQLI